ncbi:hypothetical protein OG21DRAFT_1482377 [Imleria badia]|nr:hypothetical protein OG21DRAFT_1482377 [Imleria badia]
MSSRVSLCSFVRSSSCYLNNLWMQFRWHSSRAEEIGAYSSLLLLTDLSRASGVPSLTNSNTLRRNSSLWTILLKPHTVIIKCFKATAVQLPSTPDESLRGATGVSLSRGTSSLPDPAQTKASEQRLPVFVSPVCGLTLARASAGLEIASFLAVASTGTLFALASTIGSFSARRLPTTQALALDIYTSRRSQNRGGSRQTLWRTRRDTGSRVRGFLVGPYACALADDAMSTTHVVACSFVSLAFDRSQIISPALYGFVYFKMVTGFPQAIMIVSMCTSLLALIFLSFVRGTNKAAKTRRPLRIACDE